MRLVKVAASAAAMMLAVSGAIAQDSNAENGSLDAMVCSDVTAMAEGEQQAFLRGYRAGMQESATLTTATPGVAANVSNNASTPAPAADANAAPAADANAAPAADANAAPAANANAAPAADANAAPAAEANAANAPAKDAQPSANGDAMGDTTDYAGLVAGCADTPDKAISELFGTGSM